MITKTTHLLKDPEPAGILPTIHDKYVVVTTGKALYNIVPICKK